MTPGKIRGDIVTQVPTRGTQEPDAGPGHGPSTAPTGFPVVWEQPGDERGFWQTDRMHFPDPMTPLDHDFVKVLYGEGFNRAAEQYELPIRAAARRINTYHYSAMAPNVPPEQMAEQGKRAEAQITPAIGSLGARWDGEWLPEIQGYI